jgi:hypothetical protein
MKPNEYRELIDEDAQLTEGAEVTVYWTNCYRFYEGPGTIVKANAKSLRVELAEDVASQIGGSGYPAGQVIVVPRLAAYKLWSVNNCARLRRLFGVRLWRSCESAIAPASTRRERRTLPGERRERWTSSTTMVRSRCTASRRASRTRSSSGSCAG